MRDSGISANKRIKAGIMGIMMIVVVLFFAFYITAEAEHNCTGDDCSVCACIQQCENTMHQIGSGAAALVSAVIPVFILFLLVLFSAHKIARETPVSRKVRLNN